MGQTSSSENTTSLDGPRVLTRVEIARVIDISITLGFASTETHYALMQPLSNSLIASLVSRTSPADQLRSDLETLNRLQNVIGERPLTVWLERATQRAIEHGCPEADELAEFCLKVGGQVLVNEATRASLRSSPALRATELSTRRASLLGVAGVLLYFIFGILVLYLAGKADNTSRVAPRTTAKQLRVRSLTAKAQQLKSLTAKAHQLSKDGNLAKAEAAFRVALKAAQEQGAPLLKQAGLLGSLGNVLLSLGVYREAEENHRLALKIRERLAGRASLVVATSLNNLGNSLSAQGKSPEAVPLINRAVAICEERLSANDERLGVYLNNLGNALRKAGDASAAEMPLRRAWRISKDSEDYVEATRLNNLSTALLNQGKVVEAEALLTKSLRISMETSGPESRAIAIRLNALGRVLAHKGRHAEALDYFQRSVRMARRVLGDHPDLAAMVDSLGLAMKRVGRLRRAEALYAEALAIDQRYRDHRDPVFATRFGNLGGLKLVRKKSREAEIQFRSAIRLASLAYGEEHPRVALCHRNLAKALSQQGKHLQALIEAKEGLRLSKIVNGPAHRSTAEAHYETCHALSKLERLAEAERYCRKAVWLLEDSEYLESSAIAFRSLGEVLEKRGRLAEALKSLRRAHTVLQRVLEPHDARIDKMENEMKRLGESIGGQTSARVQE